MTTINRLSTIEQIVDGDYVPIYSSANDDARKASMANFKKYLYTDTQEEIDNLQAQINSLPSSTFVQRFSGDGVQTAFTLTRPHAIGETIDVYIGGIYQNKNTFTTGGTVLTFSEAPTSGTENIEVVLSNSIVLSGADARNVKYSPNGGATVEILSDVLDDIEARLSADEDKLENTVYVSDYGAVGDGVAEDGPSIQAAIDAVFAAGGGVVVLPQGGTWKVSQDILVKHGVTLAGPLTNPGEIVPRPRYLTAVKNAIVLHPDYSIKIATTYAHANAGIRGFYIVNPLIDTNAFQVPTGQTVPWTPTAEATADTAFLKPGGAQSTAIVVGAGLPNYGNYNCHVHDVCVYGFSRLLDGNYCNELVYSNIRGDCTNGIRLRNISDLARGVGTNHLFPFITVGRGNNGILNWRNGVGFDLDCQGAYLENSFTYGHKIGFRLRRDTAVLNSCWADANPESTVFMETLWSDVSHGFLSEDGFGATGGGNLAIDHQLIGCGSSSHSYGYTTTLPTVGGAAGRKFTMTACSAWGASGIAHVLLQSGIALMRGCNFYNNARAGSAAVLIKSGMTHYDIDDCSFHTGGTTQPFAIDASVYEKGSIGPNNKSFNNQGISTHLSIGSLNGEDHSYVVVGTNSGMKLNGKYAGGAPGSLTVAPNNTTLFSTAGWGYTGVTYALAARHRMSVQDATPGAESMGGMHIFSTTSAGTITSVDRLVISSDGHVLPVTTNAYDLGSGSVLWRAVYSKALYLPGLPTSAAGLPSGAVWNDGGTLKIV